jgi:hypothetical protein
MNDLFAPPMLLTIRALTRSVLAVAGLALGLFATPSPAPAVASGRQVAMFEEDVHLLTDPVRTLRTLQELGVGVARVTVAWNRFVPAPESSRRPARFNSADPNAYSAAVWAPYDNLVRAAQAAGVTLDLSVTGPAPLWANGPNKPAGGRHPEWKPSAVEYGKFVQAITARYTGSYTPPSQGAGNAPLPRVSWWEIWNEPNFGQDLAPQATAGSTIFTGAAMYRGLVNAAWNALKATGHTRDTVILGNLDARGSNSRPRRGAPEGLPGNFGATKPMQFVRTLYCVDANYRKLRGGLAAQVGCPTNAGASRRFRAANPGLFQANGFADHPYPVNLPPDQASSKDPDFVEFTALPRFGAALDRLQRIYGSGHRFAVYNNEYGYITNPPNHLAAARFVSPATAAAYINWAEYLSWKTPRIASTMQFLLYDPDPRRAPEYGGFASGLIFYNGTHKPVYDAYRLPIFLPVTSTRRGHSLEVWGAARPARHFGNPIVQVQFQRGSHGAFTTIRNVGVAYPTGYFDQRIAFPASGSVRLAWSYPPQSGSGYSDPLPGRTFYSRTTKISVR